MRKFFIVSAMLIGFLLFPVGRAMAEGLVLKVLAINPSKTLEQEVPIKTYLPQEAKPDDIVNKDDFEIGFDTDKSLYFVQKKVTLKPGESYTLMVQIKDIWTIPDAAIQKTRERADVAWKMLENEPMADIARVLKDNILAAIDAIDASQKEDRTPGAHIAAYRQNIKILEEATKDLISLEGFVITRPPKNDLFGNLDSGRGPASNNPLAKTGFVWKLMLGIIAFLAILSGVSFVVWQKQLKSLIQTKEIDMVPPDERKTPTP